MAFLNSFIFDSSKGETPETAARKRAIAAQIMGQIGNKQARNVGEGLGNAFASIGHGITANVMNRRADAAETTGREGATTLFNDIVSRISGQPVSSGAVPMGGAAGEVSATTPGGGDSYRDAIASIESKGSGDYAAVGPTHPSLGRALGRYQIMEANIGPWSEAALGRRLTPEEFMADPALQDAVFDNRFNQYVEKYGPEGAAQAWLGGEGGVGKTNRKDSLGTSIGEYGQRFMSSLGGAPQAIEGISPSAGGLADEVADFQQTPDYASQFPGMSSQQFDGRFGGAMAGQLTQGRDGLANALAATNQQGMGQQAIQQQTQQTQQMPQVEVAQAAQGGQQQDMLGGLSIGQLMQAANNPWLNETQRATVDMLLQQKMQGMDPSRQLDMDYRRAQIDKLRSDAANPKGDETFFGNPVAIQNQDGTISYGQIGNKGSFRPIQLGEGQTFAPPTKSVDTGTETILMDQAGNVISRTPKQNRQEAADKAIGTAEGKTQAETRAEYDSITSKMPGLYGVVDRLSQLAQDATYTAAGRAVDFGRSQLGMEPRDAAVARAEYTAIVDNQILPLLRDTFGAQFTNEEGLRLAKTLGDADKSPTEKAALLRAFIEQKERDIKGLETRLGVGSSSGKTGRSPVSIGGYIIEQVD
jgi:hypothetical protein